MDRNFQGNIRACVVRRAYLTPEGDRVVDVQDGPNVYARVAVLDLVGGAESFLALPAQTEPNGSANGPLALVAFTFGLTPRPYVLGFLPASQSRSSFTAQTQTAGQVPAFAAVGAGELRVQGGRVGVDAHGGPFFDGTGAGQPVSVAVPEGAALRVQIARRIEGGALEDVAPVSAHVPLGEAQQAYLSAQLVAKLNDVAAQVQIVRAALAGLGVTLPPWTWVPAQEPDASQLAAALLVSSRSVGG